jgi:hypothetical protein
MINRLVWGLAVTEHQMTGRQRDRPLLLMLLIGVLVLEAVAMVGVAVFLVFELLTQPASSFASGVAIVVIALLAAAWLVAIVVGALRGSPWIRGAAATWQLIQIAIAIGCFQGIFARPDVGWLLLVPSIIALVLLLSPPVTAATRRD